MLPTKKPNFQKARSASLERWHNRKAKIKVEELNAKAQRSARMKTLLICLTVVLVASVCCIGTLGFSYITRSARPAVVPTAVEAPVIPTAAPTEVPEVATEAPTETEVSTETEVPVVATEAPAPVAVSCTPSIKVGLNAADTEYGEYLDTNLGKRMTFTSRRLLVPNKEWNDPLTATELKIVETTWQHVQVCIPDKMFGRVFAFGFEQGTTRYESGVLMTLEPGKYEFNLLNGEIVLWYPNQDSFAAKDLTRIVEQIKVGNFDIKSPLAFFGVTTDLLPSIPDALVKERNVQIIPFAELSVK